MCAKLFLFTTSFVVCESKIVTLSELKILYCAKFNCFHNGETLVPFFPFFSQHATNRTVDSLFFPFGEWAIHELTNSGSNILSYYAEEGNLFKIIRGHRVHVMKTDDVQKSQCFFFSKVLGNGSMKPSICKLASFRPTHVHDNHMSLQTNCAQFRAAGTLPTSGFISEDTLWLEASCRVAFVIAKGKIPHTTGEWLIKLHAMNVIEKRTNEEISENVFIKQYSVFSCKCYVLWYFRLRGRWNSK